MKQTFWIPKPPKGGYNVLWSDKEPDATSHHYSYLITAHVDPGFVVIDMSNTSGAYVYLEECNGSCERVSWKMLKPVKRAKP